MSLHTLEVKSKEGLKKLLAARMCVSLHTLLDPEMQP